MRDPYHRFLGAVRDEAAGQSPLYFCLGTVLEITPENFRIQADGHELDKDDVLINAMLQADFEEEGDFTIERANPASNPNPLEGSVTVTGAASCGMGAHSSFVFNGLYSGRMTAKGKWHVPLRLAEGDVVLLIPDRERQKYYLVMKVVSYGAVPAD